MLPLAPHIHLAVVGEDVVVLDLGADSYICVPGGRDLLRPAEDRAGLDPRDPDVVGELAAAGLLAQAATARVRPVRPARDVCEAAPDRLSAVEALRLAGAVLDLLRVYRGRPLSRILAALPPPSGAPVGEIQARETLRLARVFQRVAVWLPAPRKCLVRSFVLLRFLHRSGLDAQWVFGVRTWPFSAHCWLQLGEVALDDAAERLWAYEPILAVGG